MFPSRLVVDNAYLFAIAIVDAVNAVGAASNIGSDAEGADGQRLKDVFL